jgi:hypothetical protein
MSTPYYGQWRHNAVAALPTGVSMNPLFPELSEYYAPDLIAYVLYKEDEARTRPTRVFTSAGPIEGWKIGTLVHLDHDQTGAYMGYYKITGIHDFKSGERAGIVPDFKIKHCVAK